MLRLQTNKYKPSSRKKKSVLKLLASKVPQTPPDTTGIDNKIPLPKIPHT